MAGALAFCIGVWGLCTGGPKRIRLPGTFYVAATAGGWCFALASIFLVARARRRGWLSLKAVCLDRECRGDVEGWGFRLRCGFELEGKAYTVTPAPFWRTFASERAVGEFLARAIAQDGTCWLRVNPRNPLQAELARGLADNLLFRRWMRRTSPMQ